MSSLNLASPIKSNNSLTLDDVFCNENIGKQVDLDYNELTGYGARSSQIGDAMMNAHVKGGEILGPRTCIKGTIQRYNGQKNMFCCKGSTSAGSFSDKLLWIYDKTNKRLSAILVN